jgi:pilus assembly protein CpaB
MIGASAVFGLLAVFVAQGWLNRQAELRLKSMQRKEEPVATRTVVVAAAPLRFGDQLIAKKLREITWPEEAIPAGAFASINDALSNGKRVVLAAIEPNEPVLKAKITGPGQKATLSALIQDGMKAVTIRVNDVDGVAGFVMPGDHVDVLMTRQPDKANSSTEVVLQMVKVLAIDQSADAAADKPSVARAVTLEVDTVSAQKLSLAGSIGSLSLALRKAGEQVVEGTRQVTVGDFAHSEATPKPVEPKRYATVTVTRAGKTQDYSVVAEPDARTAGQDASPTKAALQRVLQLGGSQ